MYVVQPAHRLGWRHDAELRRATTAQIEQGAILAYQRCGRDRGRKFQKLLIVGIATTRQAHSRPRLRNQRHTGGITRIHRRLRRRIQPKTGIAQHAPPFRQRGRARRTADQPGFKRIRQRARNGIVEMEQVEHHIGVEHPKGLLPRT